VYWLYRARGAIFDLMNSIAPSSRALVCPKCRGQSRRSRRRHWI